MDSLFSIFLLTGALAAGLKKKRQASLNGAVAGLPDGHVELRNQSGVVATYRLIDGRFHLQTEIAFPYDYFLLFENGHRIPLVIEKEHVYVDIDFSNDPTFIDIRQYSSEKRFPVPLIVEPG